MCLKRKVFVHAVLTYGAETLTLSRLVINKIRMGQIAILNISLGRRVVNHIRERAGSTDAVKRTTMLKWNYAGYIAVYRDRRWTNNILEWRPTQNTYRN